MLTRRGIQLRKSMWFLPLKESILGFFALNASCGYCKAMPFGVSWKKQRQELLPPATLFARAGCICKCLSPGGAGSRRGGLRSGKRPPL